ncbi:hypothetical protein KR51_00023020 [Rubidibacter lacunae KORDI 51-2]|uniref:Uncharacterized protein n=1 Tax=Rubidibacter lacunae KORDI 51-2 TaxID=582515 RepID=U5DMX4_9CHRO|nr:hypothetical protein [Rubidibacter lacunae]ERN41045.1 hypothetical protein KR51_00023020 [Rubidibacter lacunae KORDI 51-2]
MFGLRADRTLLLLVTASFAGIWLNGTPVPISGATSAIARPFPAEAASRQSLTIVVSPDTLREPLLLKVRAQDSTTTLSGQVELDGRSLFEVFGSNGILLDLSPHLQRGRNALSLKGRYTPASAGVRVELIGRGIQASQQVSGNGIFDSEVVIEVR